MARLYLCATPIGNLEDITLRAIRTLKEVHLIAAEDTRHTKVLLDKYGITTPLISYHKFNLKERTRSIIERIKRGDDVALVSDAGMPAISDPGEELVRQAIEEGIDVTPIPGASAAVTALAASGLSTDRFSFEGFMPAKAGERRKALERLRDDERTLIFYEAPHRIVEMLKDLNRVFGNRRVAIARELTKKFEEIIRGDIEAAASKLKKPKGEFVVVVEGQGKLKAPEMTRSIKKLAADLVAAGLSKRDASRIVSEHSGLPKNMIYDMVLKT